MNKLSGMIRLIFGDPIFIGGDDYYQELLLDPAHEWIRANKQYKRTFAEFFSRIPSLTINKIRARKLLILRCGAELSATITPPVDCNVILLFPEMQKMLLATDPSRGLAVLAHELGHIVCEHSQRAIENIDAQIEADAFASSLGFKDEIITLLLRENTSEAWSRLQALGFESLNLSIKAPEIAA